ncbi:MAG: sugar ABC transporter permease [Lachnospiraceae bacterium]|nr:sugar ABC transporter permease [Lachnospiraceae bacterium]
MNKTKIKWKQVCTNYSFVLPAVLFLVIFMMYPIWYNIEMSFKNVDLKNFLDSSQQTFAGLENFRRIFEDKYFWESLNRTWIFVFFSLIFQFTIGFAFAIFFNKKFPGNKWMRAILLIAWMNPAIITGAVFKWLMAGDVGIFNFLLMKLHIIDAPVNFLASTSTSLGSVIFANIWIGIPFNMIILLSGLQSIDDDLYESAVIDGAGGFARFKYITVPMLMPTIMVLLLLGFIYTFKVFDIIYAMTSGGPANSSQILPYYAYEKAFKMFKFGEGAAASCISFIIVAVLAAIYIYFSKKEEAA